VSDYSNGGYIGIAGGKLTPVFLAPDECLIRMTRDRGPLRCVRSDHPTPTSDCTTQDWIEPPVRGAEGGDRR